MAEFAPIISISSSSRGDFFPCWVLCLGDYDASLNHTFCHYSWTLLILIVLIFCNEKKTYLVHSHRLFTLELGKDMWIIIQSTRKIEYICFRNQNVSGKHLQKWINISVPVWLTKTPTKNIWTEAIK